jgi:hypothetical protein
MLEREIMSSVHHKHRTDFHFQEGSVLHVVRPEGSLKNEIDRLEIGLYFRTYRYILDTVSRKLDDDSSTSFPRLGIHDDIGRAPQPQLNSAIIDSTLSWRTTEWIPFSLLLHIRFATSFLLFR